MPFDFCVDDWNVSLQGINSGLKGLLRPGCYSHLKGLQWGLVLIWWSCSTLWKVFRLSPFLQYGLHSEEIFEECRPLVWCFSCIINVMCFRDTARELSTVKNCKRKETRSLVDASGQFCAVKNCQSKGSPKFMNAFERLCRVKKA